MVGKYTVGEVEERTGVPASSLRQWERRYGFPAPERSPSGYRYYSESDLAAIVRMRDLIAEGVPASRAAATVKQERAVAEQARPTPDLARELASELIALDADGAERVLAEAVALYPVDVVLLEVVRAALVRVGDMWHAGEVSVATEHFASNVVQARLRALLAMLPDREGGPSVVVACAPGEQHEMGALVLAVLLRRAGFRVYYLGANTPVADLAELARERGVDAVLLSVTTREPLAGLCAERERLRSLPGLLVLGGAAVDARPEVAAELGGVFLGNDARKVVAELAALLSKRRPGGG
ncbi:MAG TPA: cobalamin-dependent protein [Trueperaceae bacterium]|nr:cobalamin-dependent protein [Trueperaceae bacterium]